MTEELDPFDSPEFREWAQSVLDDMVPKLADSAFTISLMPEKGITDVKYAVELGYSIMLDKPILLVVPPNTEVPPKLRIVADRIVEVDISTEKGRSLIGEHINDFLSYVAHLDQIKKRST